MNERDRKISALIGQLKREREKVKALTKELELDDDKLWSLVKDNTAIKNKIIAEYLAALSRPSAVSLMGQGGYSALTPVNKPKTLRDAKRLADKIIKY